MPVPDFVPVRPLDAVRPDERLPVPDRWTPTRPAEIKTVFQPGGAQLGSPGPDQGYGLKLARRFTRRLHLTYNEHADDAVAGCLVVGLKRASLFGRAPTIYDFEHAYGLWGFLAEAPSELIAFRKPVFAAASHHYEDQRAIADAVPEATLRMTPAEVAERVAEWRSLLTV